ncbi:glycerophosphodiester phosphodiesterase [Calidifontibacter sp. DB0510]|uniref:Glycerophosphodiester phosphodiesterase n=1 Tax=Metallococcus carri TaxID=1656884 RepID=A0A967B3C4_9MICO|nr:glycerophosphodiester phosphodiesterase [Metallococcus carri]NOP37978.1 glycerophosphodiester phosphodiesterase [Calidifontibacter sp. DB2511S]
MAHRGASETLPEHTLAAYERAIEVGADGVECDVRLTADKHLVCVHDRRVDRTSDGRGPVSALELAQLEGLDFGSWKALHGDDVEQPDRDSTRLLTLRGLIRAVQTAGRPMDLVIETKHPTRWAGEVEDRLVAVLEEFDLLDPQPGALRVRLMSFSTRAVQRFAVLAPKVERVLLVELPSFWRFGDGLPRNVSIVGPRVGIVRKHPDFVARHHDQGHQVHVWTVDRPEDIELCLELGVDAIISNRPAAVRAAVDAAYGIAR